MKWQTESSVKFLFGKENLKFDEFYFFEDVSYLHFNTGDISNLNVSRFRVVKTERHSPLLHTKTACTKKTVKASAKAGFWIDFEPGLNKKT